MPTPNLPSIPGAFRIVLRRQRAKGRWAMRVAAAASNPTAGGGAALSAEHSRLTYLVRMKRIGRVGGSLRWDVGDRPRCAAPQPAARRFGLPARGYETVGHCAADFTERGGGGAEPSTW